MTELLRLRAHGERDVFLVRQRGREVGQALGFDQPGQVRLATALSEVCRYLLPYTGSTTVVFRLVAGAVEVTMESAGAAPAELAAGVEAAGRLMDAVELSQTPGRSVLVMRRGLPPHVPQPTAAEADRIRAKLVESSPASVLDELGVQNAQLIAALEEVQVHRDELLRLNAELEETNRGVMALYSQLSEEMEETNRGVVALYAELDERSAQLRDSNEAKSRFLRNVSHELRAPVTAIIGMLRLLLDPGSDPLTGEQAHQLGLARTSADELLNMINQLLDLAKAESNRLEPQWSAVDLRALFSQLRGTLRHLARPAVELVVADAADVPTLVTDQVLLMQVLRNLLTNGLKFTERGEVRLAARYLPDRDRVVMTVSDTGIGIAAEETERIFEEFYQVRTAQPGATRGTGLGLPYARRLCELLGASLTLDSTPGAGSTFTVSLPRTPGGLPAVSDEPPASAAGRDRPRRVLVVDDDAAFRHRVRGMLEPDGVTVAEAADGRAALAAIAAGRPDAVVLDLRMPGMGGLEMLGELARDPDLRGIPVLVVTAAELDDVARAATAHAVAVLDKATLSDQQVASALRAVTRDG